MDANEARELGHPPGDGPFKLFVYGTLKSGQCRGNVLADQERLGDARTAGGFVLRTTGAYPCLTRAEGAGHVRGELYLCQRDMLPRLDRIEGSPWLFKLEQVELEGVEGAAYTYVYQRPAGDLRVVQGEEWTA